MDYSIWQQKWTEVRGAAGSGGRGVRLGAIPLTDGPRRRPRRWRRARARPAALFRHPRPKLGLTCSRRRWPGCSSSTWARCSLLLSTPSGRLDPLTARSCGTGDCRTSEILFRRRSTGRSRSARWGSRPAVTVADIALAFPIAYYAARMAKPGCARCDPGGGRPAAVDQLPGPCRSPGRRSSAPGGLSRVAAAIGLGSRRRASATRCGRSGLTFTYLWLPFVTPADLRGARADPALLPGGVGDLGAKGWTTFRRVIWPLAAPGHRGRFDLLVLAHARRLHRADARRATRSSSAT